MEYRIGPRVEPEGDDLSFRPRMEKDAMQQYGKDERSEDPGQRFGRAVAGAVVGIGPVLGPSCPERCAP